MTTLQRLTRAAAPLLAALLLVALPAAARAQTRVFSTATGAGAPAARCGGSPFLFCASASADYTAATGLLRLTVSNLSPSNTSVFGEIGLGNLALYTLASSTGESGAGTFALSAPKKLNGYNGVGLGNNVPGLVGNKSGSIANGLGAGETAVFDFFLRTGSAAPSESSVLTDFADARLVLHDQGGGLSGCAGSAKLSVGNYLNNAGATTFNGVTCGPTSPPPVTTNVIPEPATVALLGAGLAGLLAAGRRRRA